MRAITICATVFSLAASNVLFENAFAQDAAISEDVAPAPARLLSAFFGLDGSRRIRVRTLIACRGSNGRDGMPVILSREIDPATLDAEDFQITTEAGDVTRPRCATLRPADEQGELRTVLLVGEFGSIEDQPARVEIVGDLLSLSGDANFRGAEIDVIPLEAGPTMILAETTPRATWSLGGRGECPAAGVRSIVRVTWTGGVTRPGGDEIGQEEMRLYRVVVRAVDGSTSTVTPLAVGDLFDNDNNHELCLGVDGEPISVFFPAGALTDPNEDLNPETEVMVTSGGS